jgi:type IV secretion system protein VirB6
MTAQACPAFSSLDNGGVAGALRAVDCLTAQTTEKAFSTLLGPDGALGQALTLLLTLYVALMAVRLLTGRMNIGLSNLTPRMLGLGLVLTFATSWAAYHQVVWNLLVGAPDHLASLLAGTRGSAATLFADKLDQLFQLVLEAARQAVPAGGEKPTMLAGMRPADLLWLAGLLFLFGTVGVLVAAKVALAALLALGPVFIVLALFRATSGLFEGWLRASVLFAIVPLLTVLVGSGALALIAPMLADLSMAGGTPSPELAVGVLLGAGIFALLMLLVLRLAAGLTSGWRLGLHGRDTAPRRSGEGRVQATQPAIPALNPAAIANRAGQGGNPATGAALAATVIPLHSAYASSAAVAGAATPSVNRSGWSGSPVAALGGQGGDNRPNPVSAATRSTPSTGLGQRFRRPRTSQGA